MVNLLPLAEKQQRQRGSGQLSQARDSSQGSGLFQLFAKEVDDSLTWDFIPWLRTITKLPIYVKVKDGAGGIAGQAQHQLWHRPVFDAESCI